jgi:uncharacterized membrane protein HdeD (DUF308 family)
MTRKVVHMKESTEMMNAAGKNMKWLGILTMFLGLMALASPLMTGISLVILLGSFVLLGGIMRLIWTFRGLATGPFPILTGILTVICGLIMVSDPILASGFLTILIAIYLVTDGLYEMFAAFGLRPKSGWGWMMFGGVLSLLLGLMIWRQYPLSGAWAMGLFLGFKLLFIGMTMAGVGRAVEKARD